MHVQLMTVVMMVVAMEVRSTENLEDGMCPHDQHRNTLQFLEKELAFHM